VAEVTRWSHEAVDAYDRGDTAALGALLSEGYLHFEGGAPTRRDAELAAMTKRKPDAPHIATRTWSNEHASVHEPYLVFIGEAKEHLAGNDVHGGNNYDGWYTLLWAREGDAWKLALWTWQRAGVGAQRDVWNEVFRNGIGYNREPNQLLVDTIRNVKPGTALDVAMGQGRNALYLASRRWKVTGVDLSDEGVRAAREAAEARHLAIDAVNADLETYDFGVAKWDLVTMLYAPEKPSWIERAKKSMKSGALFVLEIFHREGPEGDGFATGQLAALFNDGFEVLRDEVVEATPDWAKDRATLVRFVARKR
jgi:SAM-dependent methyltransferase